MQSITIEKYAGCKRIIYTAHSGFKQNYDVALNNDNNTKQIWIEIIY